MTSFFEPTTHNVGIIVEGGINLGENEWEIKKTDCDDVEDDVTPSLQFCYRGETIAKIIADKGGVTPNFVGKSHCFMVDVRDMTNFIGLIVSSTGKYYNLDMSQSPSIVSGSTPTIKFSDIANDSAVFGVVAGIENYGREVSSGAIKTVLYQDDGVNRIFVNNLGLGLIWVCDINGSIRNGDYITTSGVKGFGMKQDSDLKHSYTVAKATQNCVFSPKRYILTKPVDFDEHGPVYVPILTHSGDTITDCDYLVKFINRSGDFISGKEYEEGLNDLVMKNGKLSLTHEEKRSIAMKSLDRNVFRASLVGCVFTIS